VADASRFTYDASRANGRPSAYENPFRSDALDEQRKQVEANLSADLVRHLQSQGMTLRRIGESMGLSESFISRVAHRKRSLTIEHLLRLQEATGTPLPLLLLEAVTQDSVPEALAPLYQEAREVLAAGAQTRRSTRKRHRKTA